MLTIICAVLIVIGHVPDVACQTGAHVKELKKKLFTTETYDYKIRPTNTQSMPIGVTVDLHLLAINEVSETSETLKTTAFLKLTWDDEFLVWDSTDTLFPGVETAFWPQDDVWKPDIALKNSNIDYHELGVPTLNIKNGYEGKMEWLPFHVFESTCAIDITNFPFDYQTCFLKFQAWSYSKNEVFMIGGADGIELTEYEPNSEWDMISTSWTIEEDTDDSAISFKLTIKRKPLYFLLSVIFPIILLAILDICVFLLPCTSGEKAGYAITVFLAFAVFLTIVSSQLPANSESVSLIAVFLIIQTICSTLITILALALLRMHSFDETTAVPRVLVFFMRCLKCRSCKNNVAPIRGAQKRATDESSSGDGEYSWNEVVNFLDAVLFVIFTIILVAAAVGCFVRAFLDAKP